MLKSNFLLCEGVQNASFLKINSLFCKGIQGDICFSWAVAKNNFYQMISTTHHSPDIHCILPCAVQGLQATKFILSTFNDSLTLYIQEYSSTDCLWYCNQNSHSTGTVYVTHVGR